MDESPGNSAELKKANPKSLHNIMFHLYNFFEMTVFRNKGQLPGFRDRRREL